FFQAEDGIRDGHVTGVQTCALPILMMPACWPWSTKRFVVCCRISSLAGSKPAALGEVVGNWAGAENATRQVRTSSKVFIVSENRSEERRVGKECRNRGGGEQENKRI